VENRIYIEFLLKATFIFGTGLIDVLVVGHQKKDMMYVMALNLMGNLNLINGVEQHIM
jgi:hypothetical protein